MRVSNLESPRSGNPVANQFVIEHEDREYFQSYQTLIAMKYGVMIFVGAEHAYSRTTSKYFFEWLRSLGLGYHSADINRWLKSPKTHYGDMKQFGSYTLQLVEDINDEVA